jgi:AcrR family transcriptional regulator
VSRPEPPTARGQQSREQLLARAIDFGAREGISDVSLRQLATELGTSHRMLIYHFGSKEGLLTAVVGEMERRQREALADLRLDPSMAPAEIGRRMWRRFADPELWPLERLFFELYAQALQGREHTGEFLHRAMEPWLEQLTDLHRSWGAPPATARAQARLGIAVARGLLLDLLATGDRRGVDRAMKLFVDSFERSPYSPASTRE